MFITYGINTLNCNMKRRKMWYLDKSLPLLNASIIIFYFLLEKVARVLQLSCFSQLEKISKLFGEKAPAAPFDKLRKTLLWAVFLSPLYCAPVCLSLLVWKIIFYLNWDVSYKCKTCTCSLWAWNGGHTVFLVLFEHLNNVVTCEIWGETWRHNCR